MFGGGFKRSSLFGLIGIVVVAALVVLIAMSTGEGQSNPKTTYALIFGVLAVFIVILFVLQRSDLNRVAGGDAKAVGQRSGCDRRRAQSDPQLDPLEETDGGGRSRGDRRQPQGGGQADWLCDLWLAEAVGARSTENAV